MNKEDIITLAGQVALLWDEHSKRDTVLELCRSIESDTEIEKKSLETVAWYIKERWGNNDEYLNVLGILNDLQNGEFHIEQVEDLELADIEQDLLGKVAFLQPGHTVRGKGSGYISPHAEQESNEQKFWLARLLNVKKRLEARGCKVFLWARTEGGFGTHARKTQSLIRQRCPDAMIALQGHWNAATPKAHGYEVIVTSKAGLMVGVCISKRMKERFPDMTARDYDGVREKSTGRGVAWLKQVPPPAGILELFFASNQTEMKRFESEGGKLGLEWVIENGVADYLTNR